MAKKPQNIANPVGRPPMWNDPEKLQTRIDEYFEQVGDDEYPMITGLVMFCGFCDRHSFYEYEKKEKFSHTIKNARTRIESVYESYLMKGGAGPIFALKNFGWTDKQEIELSGGLASKTDDELAARLKQLESGV